MGIERLKVMWATKDVVCKSDRRLTFVPQSFLTERKHDHLLQIFDVARLQITKKCHEYKEREKEDDGRK